MESYDFIKTDINGVYIVEHKSDEDTKGFFIECYTKEEFEKNIGTLNFVQDIYFSSDKGVIRGLHFQKVKPQSRLIRVMNGSIYNVYIDIRITSKTFGQWRGVYLSSENKKQLYIPQGFANGFLALSNNTEVIYKCDELYYPEYKGGIIWNDNILKINWHATDPVVSAEDKRLYSFKDFITENSLL